MKNIVLLTVILIFGTTISFKSKDKMMSPPGTIKVKANFFVDKTEIRNIDWREYMYWSKQFFGEKSNKFLSTIPDTTIWKNEILERNQKQYLRHSAFRDYPVVGVSYEQAVLYCKWRSDRVNEMEYIRKTGVPFSSIQDIQYEKIPKVYKYRLPTEEEWINISNQKELIVQWDNIETEHKTYPIKNSKKKVIYCLTSNVSEMTSVNGVAMGGNWKGEEGLAVYKYDVVSNLVGFRCVCDKNIE